MNNSLQSLDLKLGIGYCKINEQSCFNGNIQSNDISKTSGQNSHMKNVLKKAFKTIEIIEKWKIVSKSKKEVLSERFPLNILIAEDNLINQKVLYKLLEFLGYKADVALDGVKAVECCENKKYDIVFMDIEMPEMDGFQATECILNSFKVEKKPIIIAFTANASKKDCLKAGMVDFLSKPVSFEQIEKCVKTWGKKISQKNLQQAF
ncbi:MAG: response regulator [Bacteroidetes bacterium]|nr:response regulator [Bacteroidota bacterium]